MQVSALILLEDCKNIEESIQISLSAIPVGIDKVLFMLPHNVEKVLLPEYPVIRRSNDESPLLPDFLDVLKQFESGRLLILSGKDSSITCENIENLLEYSNRLPHMTVVSAKLGCSLDYPIVLPVSVKLDIADFIQACKGAYTVSDWLDQGVYIECELSSEIQG